MVCFKAIMISKPQSYLASKRSRHQRSDGDCTLSLGTPVASRNGHVGHNVRPDGSGSRLAAAGPLLELVRLLVRSILLASGPFAATAGVEAARKIASEYPEP